MRRFLHMSSKSFWSIKTKGTQWLIFGSNVDTIELSQNLKSGLNGPGHFLESVPTAGGDTLQWPYWPPASPVQVAKKMKSHHWFEEPCLCCRALLSRRGVTASYEEHLPRMIPYQRNDLARGFFVSYTQVIFSVLNASSASEARKRGGSKAGWHREAQNK